MFVLSVQSLLQSGLVLGGLGLLFGGLIAVAQRHLRVWEDPRIDAVSDELPGSNCGACGFAGCRSFAEGLVAAETAPAVCTQMTSEAIDSIADYLGVDAGDAAPRVARLLCAGGQGVARQDATYRGLATCSAAAAASGGGKACPWGCLGLADCVVVCNDEAIALDASALPVVLPERCTACGNCVDACPRELLQIMPLAQQLLVQCKSALEGDAAEALCAVACTACGRCVQDAPPGTLVMEGGLPVLVADRTVEPGPEVTARCPTAAIVWINGAQSFTDEREPRHNPQPQPANAGDVRA